ncbi:hypothetical protein [Lentzea aerocolonigenes]|uniref:hypothetical protein n=1 Tax=Lentzea aerocolonigenes TaxID=68170 RepID=UPI0012E32175|nr:hypothetical protein [Lentzea aerocolonigenes]
MMDESWLAGRVREFAALRGRHIESWVGVEWALREDVAGTGPQFRDPSVPCLQLWGLLATLDDDEPFGIGTYEHSTDCGLWRHEWLQPKLQNQDVWDGITRWQAFGELPTGHVDEVAVFVGSSVVAEVLLTIGGRPLLLMAGEASETWGDELRFVRLDESVLVFTDPAEADSISWASPREGLVQVTPDLSPSGVPPTAAPPMLRRT